MEEIVSHIDSHEGCFVGNLCQEMAGLSLPIAKGTESAFKFMTNPINDCLIEAQETGDLDKSVNTRLLAEFIENSWGGALMRIKGSKTREALDAYMYMLENRFF